MNPQQYLLPLTNQLDLLIQVVNESPYLSSECRKQLDKEIYDLKERFEEGAVSFSQGEHTLRDLNNRAAMDEITNLMNKIHYLNPSSSRLEMLRELSRQLGEGEASPEQVRESINQIMQVSLK
ncbi:MAG: hypothetical protein WAM28_07535 [Chlamydiales bacterium]